MRRILCVVLAGVVLLTSCSATMVVRGTAPTTERGVLCSAPTPFPLAGSVMMHVAWTGASSGEDSLSVAPGAPFVFTKQVASGTYQIRAWGSNPGGPGCDTLISRSFASPPSTPSILP